MVFNVQFKLKRSIDFGTSNAISTHYIYYNVLFFGQTCNLFASFDKDTFYIECQPLMERAKRNVK